MTRPPVVPGRPAVSRVIRVKRRAALSPEAAKIAAKAVKEARDNAFRLSLAVAGIHVEPVAEHRFHPTRKWRWDWSWPERKLAIEVDGGVWTRGKHGRGAGIVQDHAKQNAAVALGWRVMRCTPRDLTDPAFARLVAEAYRVSSG